MKNYLVIILILVGFLMTSCKSDYDINWSDNEVETWTCEPFAKFDYGSDYGPIGQLQSVYICTAPTGRECIVTDRYNDTGGGITCDWEVERK